MTAFRAHTPLPNKSRKAPKNLAKIWARASLLFPVLGLLFLSTSCATFFPSTSPEELERYPTSPVSTEEAPEENQKNTQASPEEEGEKEIKCLAVCKRWGRRCSTGSDYGVSRCQRVCESFGRDCFEVQ